MILLRHAYPSTEIQRPVRLDGSSMPKQDTFLRRRLLQAMATAITIPPWAGPAFATSASPPRSCTLVCPYPPGGLGDATARLLAKALGDRWKVPVVVDNRTGATGMIGAAAVAKGPADGSLLLCMLPEALSVAKALNMPLGFDPATDLKPVALCVISGCILATNALSRFATYEDMRDYARSHPAQLNFGIQGTGSAFHLAMERWALAENIRVTAVPYKGGSSIVTDLLGGQLDAMFMATSLGLPYVRDGKLRALAVASRSPIAELPGVRRLVDMGVKDFEVPFTLAVLGPSAMSDDAVQALNAELLAIMQSEETRAWMSRNVVTTPALSAPAFRARMLDEIRVFSDVVRRANIKLT